VFWIQADLLKTPGVEPMIKLRATKPFRGYIGILIFNDRVEFHEGTWFLKLKGDPIPMTEVKEVEIKHGRLTDKLTLEALDGRSMTIGNLDPQKAASAKALIEQRMAVYKDEDLVESPIVPPQLTDEENSDSPSAAASDIPGQIRQLAELRDAGIVSEEEFQAKKAELLDRM
jgi:hypothetical protein